MAWIEAHQTLADHPKRKRLSRLLGISAKETLGLLLLFWWWCMDYAQDGDLTRFDDGDLADAADWQGDAAAFVEAMTASGFIAKDRTVHDWDDYAGRLIEKREANTKRMREARAMKKSARATNVRRTCDERATNVQSCASNVQGLPNPTQPNPTLPNQTIPPLPPKGESAPDGAGVVEEEQEEELPFSEPLEDPPDDVPEIELAAPAHPVTRQHRGGGIKRSPRACPKPKHEYTPAFEGFWERYPNRVNKLEASKLFEALARDNLCPAIEAGLSRYLASDKWLRDGGRYVEGPDVWLRNRRFEDHPKASVMSSAITSARAAPNLMAPARRSVSDVAQSWLEKRRDAGL